MSGDLSLPLLDTRAMAVSVGVSQFSHTTKRGTVVTHVPSLAIFKMRLKTIYKTYGI